MSVGETLGVSTTADPVDTLTHRSGGTVGFYGTTPISQKSVAQQTTKTTTQLRSELSALQNALASYGLISVT